MHKRLGFMTAAILAVGLIASSPMKADAFEIQLTTDGRPIFNLCTGVEGGGYHTAGQTLARFTDKVAKINVIATGGTMDNLRGMASLKSGNVQDGVLVKGGQRIPCHLSFYQLDGEIAAKKKGVNANLSKIRDAYPEVIHLIVKSGSKWDELDDFESGNGKIAVVDGSGAWITLIAFGELESNYKSIVPEIVGSWREGIDRVVDGDVQGLLYVSSYTSSFMQNTVNKTGGIELAEIVDGDLDDDGVYKVCELDSSAYSKLLGWSDYDTMCVESAVGIQRDIEQALKDKGLWSEFRDRVSTGINNIRSSQELKLLDIDG